jgi:hypothetical protein
MRGAINLFSAGALLLIVTACYGVGSAYYTVRMQPSELAEVSTPILCNALQAYWGPLSEPSAKPPRDSSITKDVIIDELQSRGIFSEDDWFAITHGRIFFGMSEDAVRCARFPPGLHKVIAEKTGPWGQRKVVDSLFDSGRIYLENGVVVAYEKNPTRVFGKRWEYESLVSTLRTTALLLRPEDISGPVFEQGDLVAVELVDGSGFLIEVAEQTDKEIVGADGSRYGHDEIRFVALVQERDADYGKLHYDWSKFFEGWGGLKF